MSSVGMLLGCAALTIDVGNVGLVSARTQSVADACALAAAGGPITGHEAEVEDRIRATLAANQQQGCPAYLDDQSLSYYGGGQYLPDYGTLGANDQALTLSVRVPVQCTFSRVFGISERVVRCTATAVRSASRAGQPTIFAADALPDDYGVSVDGSGTRIEGPVQSSTGVRVPGSSLVFTDPVNYANDLSITGTNVAFEGGTHETQAGSPPISYSAQDFAPYTQEIYGDYVVTDAQHVVAPGCYRVHGHVVITGAQAVMSNVTFVADGVIVLAGSQQVYSPARHGVFAYSLIADHTPAIALVGSATNGSGTLYAPQGSVCVWGSGSLASTMVAWYVGIGGGAYTITPTPQGMEGTFTPVLVR